MSDAEIRKYPRVNGFDENGNISNGLKFAVWSTGGSSDYRNDRERPYNGQPHTDHGERGKTLVDGLTMRDVMDCFVMGVLAADGRSDEVDAGVWRYGDVYNVGDIDLIAAAQNMSCYIEKMMGIYPNVPKIVPTTEELIDHWTGEKGESK